jgi:TonB-linked SusC/RagA family outer membrane protein
LSKKSLLPNGMGAMKKASRHFKLLFSFILFFSVSGLAQTKTITGRVTGENNQTLAGVTVKVKGKTNSAVTNESGVFTIAASTGDVLVFTSVGYGVEEAKVGSGNSLDVALIINTIVGDEVIVVGYGTQRVRDLTGSIASIKTNNLPKTANTSINNLLQGRAAGLNLDVRSAQPGGRLNVNVRGALDRNGQPAPPLYIIDGVPIFNSTQAEPAIISFGSAVETGFNGGIDRDPLSNMNPSDVESVTVLKDASATAIYGAAAANGVILITTKKGKANGRVNTEYRGSYTAQTAKDYFTLLNAREFMQQQVRLARDRSLYLANAAPYGPNAAPAFTPLFSQSQIDAAGEGTDWLDLLMRTGNIQDHNVSLSGGTENTRVYTSFNYYNNKAIVENSDFVRYAGRVNMDQRISGRIKLSVQMQMSQINSKNQSTGNGGNSEKFNSLQTAYAFAPHLSIYDNAGKFTKTLNTQITNPAAFLIMNDKLRTTRFFAAPNLEIKILNNLKVNLTGGIDKTKAERKFFLPAKAQNYLFPRGMGQLSTQTVHNYNVEGYATYNKNFGDHAINLVGGGGYYKNFSEDFAVQGAGYFTDALGYNNIGLADDRDKTLIRSNRSVDMIKYSSFLRVNYNYKSKYFFTFNGRTDASSNFAVNKKWGFFPGISAAWRISSESFLSNSKIISDLKLRVGYGSVGNDRDLNALALYSAGGATVGSFLIGSTYYPGVSLSQLESPNLTWETNKDITVGLDFGVLKGRISGVIDLYRRDRMDIIDYAPLPYNNAVGRLATNLGSQRTQGIEFTVNSVNFQGKFSWETSFNISSYKSRWIERNPYYVLRPWEKADDRLDIVYGWQTNGIIKSLADKPAYLPAATVNVLGNIIYVDQNKDNALNNSDVVVLGYQTPKWIFGLGNRFTYHNFDLDVFVYGRLKQSQANNLAGFYAADRIGIPAGQNTLADIKNVWSADNTSGFYPGIANNPVNGSNASGNNDFYRQNVNYLRVRNITLGYTFNPKKIISSARLFVDVQNAALWTNYKGYDPEIAVGNEGNPYPQALSTTVGININF